jgi:hypothetical protein
MAIENLPRPWLLAALTGLKVAELLALEQPTPTAAQPQRPLPRPERRRRQLPDAPGRRSTPAGADSRLN